MSVEILEEDVSKQGLLSTDSTTGSISPHVPTGILGSHGNDAHSPNSEGNNKQCKRIIINMGDCKVKQGHRCTVECLNRYPIHHAARIGKFKDLKKLLDGHKCTPKGVKPIHDPDNPDQTFPTPCCPLERDECLGRTPLHYAASTGNVEKGLVCVRLLLECSAIHVETPDRSEKIRKFVNAVDYNHETALHLAARNEAVNIVKELLMNQADLEIKSYDGRCGLMEVYRKTPLAMTDALSQSISYVEFCKRDMDMTDEDEEVNSRKSSASDELDFTHSYVSVCLNFYPILGSNVSRGRGKSGAYLPETCFLYEINRKKMQSDVRRVMLKNVLVQAFLHFKWSKIKMFCFFAIFLHIIWLALYIGIVIDVFVVNCPYEVKDKPEEGSFNSAAASTNETKGNTDSPCEINQIVHYSSFLLLIFSVGIGMKEFFQFIRLRSLYIRFENVGQCLLLTFIFISIPNLYLYQISTIDPLQYQLSAFGIFLGWTLLLCQLAKLPRFCVRFKFFSWRVHVVFPDHGLYVEILTRVFKNFLVFITIFSSLLISFVFSFNILLPNSTGFINLSNSVLKVLTMMTGELDYDDIFHSEEKELIYPISSHVMYAIFIMVATIILFNLLIGFTVSDIQGLQQDAEVNQISNKLEQIFLMECFILSAPMQLLLGIFVKIFMRGSRKGKNDILSNIMVTRRTSHHTWLCYHTKIKSLPVKHRVEIRDWASKNCVSISDITGVTRHNMFQSSFTRH